MGVILFKAVIPVVSIIKVDLQCNLLVMQPIFNPIIQALTNFNPIKTRIVVQTTIYRDLLLMLDRVEIHFNPIAIKILTQVLIIHRVERILLYLAVQVEVIQAALLTQAIKEII